MGQVCAKFILRIEGSSNGAIVVWVVHEANSVEMGGELRQVPRVENVLRRPHAADTRASRSAFGEEGSICSELTWGPK